MVTLKDIAQQLNISVSTASRALAGQHTISEATIKRVQALAKKLGYQPNAVAVGLRKGQSKIIGVMTPHLGNNFFARIVTGIEEAAAKAGYQILICQSGDDTERERRNLTMLLNAQVAGVLASLSRNTQHTDHFDQLREQGVPLVFFDRFLEGYAGNAVVIDDRAGGYQATRHLLAQGYRRIAHVAGPQHISIYKNRRLGYEDALREQGLPVLGELIPTSNVTLADGATAAQQLLSLPQPPDAIFSASDFAALGIMQVIKAKGLKIPADVGLVGFSNELFSQFTEPALTSVDQHGEQIGQAATTLLLQLKGASHLIAPQHTVLQPTLLVRASSTR